MSTPCHRTPSASVTSEGRRPAPARRSPEPTAAFDTRCFMLRAARSGALLAALAASVGCGNEEPAAPSSTAPTALAAVIGPGGGSLRGAADGPFAGVEIVIPAGALEGDTEISVTRVAAGERSLPEAAKACGPMFALEPVGLALGVPAEVTLPFDEAVVRDELRFPDEVKIWVSQEQGWDRERQLDHTADTVTFELGQLAIVAAGINPPKPQEIVSFTFAPVAAFEPCMAQYPNDPARRPLVEALVVPGEGADTMFLFGQYIKPGLGFDLFSLERSLFDANGQRDPGFRGFGLAWYQTDLEANRWGKIRQVIRTVLLDEAFGLDAGVGLAPTRTFHAGFWFTDPEAAAACGFDPNNPTPFNGEQRAGPLAMISLPDKNTGVGPLCTDIETCLGNE